MAPPRGRPRQTDPSSRTTARSTPLPPYQPPSHPLNTTAQRLLHDLPRSHRVDGLQTHLTQAINNLTAAAGDINDRSQQKSANHQKRKARRLARDGIGAEEEEGNKADRAVEELRGNVEEMTAELERRVRKIVDAKAAVENVATVLRELDVNLSSGQGVVAPTQSTLGASQLREKRRRPNVDLSDEEDEVGETANSMGPLGVFKRKIDGFRSEYENSSMRHRYASNNDYIGFKKIVHDACHPQHDAPPVPHPSTWFPNNSDPSSSHPTPSSSSNNNNNKNNRPNSNRNPFAQNAAGAAAAAAAANNAVDDDDDEIEVASERISINCPLTLRPMQVPVSSSICPHSFEQAAIMEMISKSPLRQRIPNARAGEPGVERQLKCPVSGCNAILSPSLLHPDPILLRKIKRRLQVPSRSPSPSASPSASPTPPPPSSSRRLAGPSSQAQSQARKFKREREREVSMIPATQLGPEVEVEAEEEEEEEREDGEGEGEGEGEEEEEDEEEEETEISRTQIVDLE